MGFGLYLVQLRQTNIKNNKKHHPRIEYLEEFMISLRYYGKKILKVYVAVRATLGLQVQHLIIDMRKNM